MARGQDHAPVSSERVGATEFDPRARAPAASAQSAWADASSRLCTPPINVGTMSETVLHDVPMDAPSRRYTSGASRSPYYYIAPKRDLTLIRLHGNRFDRIDESRSQLIESDRIVPQLAAWGQAYSTARLILTVAVAIAAL